MTRPLAASAGSTGSTGGAGEGGGLFASSGTLTLNGAAIDDDRAVGGTGGASGRNGRGPAAAARGAACSSAPAR